MATYVMSDIHGESSRFQNLLRDIHFSSEDVLYIIGDVIDRGDDGILLLQEIMIRSNITLILGNHELMFLKATESNSSIMDIRSWIWNGGDTTLKAFQMLEANEQIKIRQFLQNCPDHVVTTVHDKEYYLVHGWPGSSIYERCWKHPPYGIISKNPMVGRKLIVGHTVTLRLYANDPLEQHYYLERTLKEDDHLRIAKTPEFIAIDCGCGYLDISVRRLSCIRLDDGKEFYA